jgi:cellulose synthase/poly-beta-1,6-N-acetylglucosamine synthase-like glycosyltransferase
MELVIVFGICYFILLFSILGIGSICQQKKEKSYQFGKKIQLDNLTVIVPFRNEEKRIDGLIQSLINSKKLPKQILFVNDHSDDQSILKIEMQIGQLCNIQILNLPDELKGKKQAIRYGTEKTKTEFVLTLDADVIFDAHYFPALEQLGDADLYLLPAIMKAKKPFHFLYEIDLHLINAINTGLNGLNRPIIASGANLLFKRKSFQVFDRFENHAHIPSGDDIYLLRDFREAECDIRLMGKSTFQVETETPQSFNEFLHQRIRWIVKTGNVGDHFSTALAIIQFIFILSFWVIEIDLIIKNNFSLASLFFCFKTSLDLLFFYSYFKEFNRMAAFFLIPIYQLIFPIYNLLLIILMPFFKPIWKGRYSGLNGHLQK